MDEKPKYLVVTCRDGVTDAIPFTDKAEAVAFHDLAQSQWSECYLCIVMPKVPQNVTPMGVEMIARNYDLALQKQLV